MYNDVNCRLTLITQPVQVYNVSVSVTDDHDAERVENC